MKQEIGLSGFQDAFKRMGREDNFTYEGLEALYDYLEEIEGYVLDVIALCCEFNEYVDINEYLKDHDTDLDKTDFMEEESKNGVFLAYDYDSFDEERFNKAVFEEISNKTTLIMIDDDKFIIGSY